MIELGPNQYGKRAIRLVKVTREPTGHRVRDLTIDVALEGDFAAAHTAGDNSLVVATDTMKNTAYAFAADHLDGAIEAYGLALATHFLEFAQVDRAVVGIREQRWKPIERDGSPAPDAFRRIGDSTRTASVAVARDRLEVVSGIDDLVVMKTAKSGFTGFPRDRYTTLPEAEERVMATRITATWRHTGTDVDWDASHAAIAGTLLDVFVEHRSESVQHSIWLMGRAMLDRHPEIDEVHMTLPNLHHWVVDLAPFGGTNRGEIFVATTEPHGLIEATVRRGAGE